MAVKQSETHPSEFICYELILSSGERIKVDHDEIWRVIAANKSGDWAKLRNGLVNPSYIQGIVLDKARTEDLRRSIDDVRKQNEHDRLYNGGENQKRYPEFRSLKDIFAQVQLEAPRREEKKLLGNS